MAQWIAGGAPVGAQATESGDRDHGQRIHHCDIPATLVVAGPEALPAWSPRLPGRIVNSRNSRFSTIHLRWNVERHSRAFRVKVVEPARYSPRENSDLFTDIVTSLLVPEPSEVDRLGVEAPTTGSERFDLLTFPEIFVSAETLVTTVESLLGVTWSGCMHVGLRPSTEAATHLFSCGELRKLVARLAPLAESIASDLLSFRGWLDRQATGWFNVGCLMAVDVDGQVRLCLHPKIVRSRHEVSPTTDRHMTEADLLVLVTLLPADRQFLSVTIQPLLCSDLLGTETDAPGGPPLEAITRHAGSFEGGPPDHVDVVSVATCTPQPKFAPKVGKASFDWHDQFRDAFKRAADGPDCVRHRFSIIVLSNFLQLGSEVDGGLSGVFMPVPSGAGPFHRDIAVSTWGRPRDGRGNNSWSGPGDNALTKWENRGFVAGLDPFAASAQATVRIFAFTVQRLPRERALWRHSDGLAQCKVSCGERDGSGPVRFRDVEDGNASK